MRNRALIAASLMLASVAGAQVIIPFTAETPIIPSSFVGDVAIFPNPANPAQSRIIGTDRLQNGLFTFPFDGGAGEFLSLGPMSGVDVRTGLRFKSVPSALLVASSVNTGLFVYGLSDAGMLVDACLRAINIPGVGAVALWSPPDGGLEVFLDVGTTKLRRIAFFEVGSDAGLVDWLELDAGLVMPRAVTAMVVDSHNQRLYLSVASEGVYGWSIDSPSAPVLLEPTNGGSLNGAPTGLGLYSLRDGGAVLLVSVLGRDDFAAYRLTSTSLTPLTRFQLSRGNSAVLVRNSQYLDISQAKLPNFPAGVLAVADPNSTTGANYKLVDWETLAAATDPKLPNEYDASVAIVDSGVVVIGGCPDETDGGMRDASVGSSDGGAVDAGRRPCVPDAGPGTVGDGGSADGGQGGGFDGGTGDSGGGSGGGGGGMTEPKGCCAGGPMGAIFPGAFVLLWTLSFRRRKTDPQCGVLCL